MPRHISFLTVALAAACAVADRPAAEAAGARVILGAGGYWRQHVTLRPAMVSLAAAKAAGMKTDPDSRRLAKHGRRSRLLDIRTDGPLAEWVKPGFDDSAWDRTRGAYVAARHEIGLLCRRGRFVVNDPGGVTKLTLEVGYFGGVVVHLNGREVARAHLPAGALTPDTLADDYPLGAFIVAEGARKGKPLHHYYDRALTGQFALRRRRLGPVALPARLLRKGVNVLTVACHPSGYPVECRKAGLGEFVPLGARQIFLRVEGEAEAVASAVVRRPGLHVWNADVTEEVTDVSFAPPGEALRPVRIAAVRNGTFSGQIVVGSTDPIKGLSAAVGPLASGKATIPASAVTIRYGRPTPRLLAYHGGRVYGGPTGAALGVRFRRLEALTASAADPVPVVTPAEKLRAETRTPLGLPPRPVGGAVAPVWVSVKVPADVPAGTYKATLTISAAGRKDVAAPVELVVADWTLPAIPDYVSHFSVYQSPDTLAAYYKVKPWSDAHWRLIEKSVKLIGEASNHTIVLPLLSKEQVGNEESYIRWIKQPDGSFKHDTTVLERYVDTVLKYHDPRRIAAVCLIVWGNPGVAGGNPYQKGKYDERGLPRQPRGEFTVTELDPATGRRRDMPVPPMGSRQFEDFWRGAIHAVRGRLAERGLADKIMYGMPADPPIPALVVAAFRRILPEAGWFVGNHPGSRGYRYDREDRKAVVPATHVERVYTSAIPDPAKKRQFGWQRKDMALGFNRYGFGPLCLFPVPRVWAFRILMETDLAANHRGAGRIGADYWAMGLRANSGGAGTFYARYPKSATGQTGMGANTADLLAPGPDGPVSTARFENLREGVQNAEAVVFIQKALLDKRITGDKATALWKLLDERVNACRVCALGLGSRGWQQRDLRLHEAAADVGGLPEGPQPQRSQRSQRQ